MVVDLKSFYVTAALHSVKSEMAACQEVLDRVGESPEPTGTQGLKGEWFVFPFMRLPVPCVLVHEVSFLFSFQQIFPRPLGPRDHSLPLLIFVVY